MDLKSLGIIIAKREYDHVNGSKVLVLIGTPEKFPPGEGFSRGDSYYCPFQIKGCGSEKIMHQAGIDSLQALVSAIEMAGGTLLASEVVSEKRIRWKAGNRPDDFGFDPSQWMQLK